jgi:hypothetical protein
LEKLIDITEKTFEIIIEILARIHKHRIKDKTIEKNEDLEEDGHDKWKRKT